MIFKRSGEYHYGIADISYSGYRDSCCFTVDHLAADSVLHRAEGFASIAGYWMNNSGFWIFAKMSGLTEVETLKTWTVTVSTLAIVGLCFTIAFAKLLPIV